MLKNIFMGCLPFGFSEADIRQECAPFGRVQTVDLQQDLVNATFDAFAYVQIDTDDVDRLLNELDGKRIGNRLLRVNEAVTREEDGPGKAVASRGNAKAAHPAPVCV